MPEYVDPIDWVDSANEWVTGSILGDEEIGEAGIFDETDIPGEEDPFPSLTSVPDDRPSIRSLEERQNIANELVSDRANARYDDVPVGSTPASTLELEKAPVPATRATQEEISGSDVTQTNASTTAVEKADKSSLEQSAYADEKAAPNGVQKEFLISPPSVPDVPAWRSVEDSFNEMFQASGGVGSDTTARIPAERYVDQIVGSIIGAENSRVHAAVIYFGHGSAKLSSVDKKVLKEVAVAVAKSGGHVSVVGHASSRTKTNDVLKHNLVNYETSLARAESVAKELVRQGLSSDRVSVHAMADGQPSYSEATKLGEAANRRANVYVDF